jgi:anti-sigma factor RsiW
MHCRDVIARTSAYIDDELDSAVASEMVDHFGLCKECRRELDELSRIDAFIKDLPSAVFIC